MRNFAVIWPNEDVTYHLGIKNAEHLKESIDEICPITVTPPHLSIQKLLLLPEDMVIDARYLCLGDMTEEAFTHEELEEVPLKVLE